MDGRTDTSRTRRSLDWSTSVRLNCSDCISLSVCILLLSERTPLERCCVHNMSLFVSSSGLSPGSRDAKVHRAKVCLNCTEPSVARSTCLADDMHLPSESSARSLRSSSRRKCSVTHVHSRFGDRCFAAAGPRIWNNLPASLRDKEVSCTEFRRQLKTFMFQTDCGASNRDFFDYCAL